MLAVVGDLGDAGSGADPLGAWMPRADCSQVEVEQVSEVGVERVVARLRGGRTNVSKNHVVWVVPLVGLTSGIDWTVWSSADSGVARVSVSAWTSA